MENLLEAEAFVQLHIKMHKQVKGVTKKRVAFLIFKVINVFKLRYPKNYCISIDGTLHRSMNKHCNVFIKWL